MIVTIVTFKLSQPASLADITKTFQATAPKYQGVAGLLRKNYWMSEDGRRAGGIYVWESRADADRLYTAEWKKFVEGKYGAAPQIEIFGLITLGRGQCRAGRDPCGGIGSIRAGCDRCSVIWPLHNFTG